MFTDFTALSDYQQHERELTERLERRRIAAERATAKLLGGRLELIAKLAKESRRPRSVRGGAPAAG